MIKNIIFDLGNVLLRFEPHKLLIEMFPDKVICDELMFTVFKSQEWEALDQGMITDEEALQVFVERCPHLEDEIRSVMKSWTKALTPMVANIEVLETLKVAGYSLYVLSNFHKTAYEEQVTRHSFFNFFDGGVVSAYVHQLKPNREIYMTLMDKYHLEPGTCLFIDDMKANIEAATQLGIMGIQVTAESDLRIELKRHLII